MSKKSTQEEENLIEEINLDEIVFEEETEEKLEPTEDDLWEEELSLEEDYEWDDKKLEKGLKKMPVDRSEDKRRLGKGLQKFIDVEVPKEILDGMPEDIQELMRKWKKEWKNNSRWNHGSSSSSGRWFRSTWWNLCKIFATQNWNSWYSW